MAIETVRNRDVDSQYQKEQPRATAALAESVKSSKVFVPAMRLSASVDLAVKTSSSFGRLGCELYSDGYQFVSDCSRQYGVNGKAGGCGDFRRKCLQDEGCDD